MCRLNVDEIEDSDPKHFIDNETSSGHLIFFF